MPRASVSENPTPNVDEVPDNPRRAWLFGYLLAMLAGATIALILSLMAGLSWQACLMLMAAAAILMGGVLFSILEVRRLAGRSGGPN